MYTLRFTMAEALHFGYYMSVSSNTVRLEQLLQVTYNIYLAFHTKYVNQTIKQLFTVYC